MFNELSFTSNSQNTFAKIGFRGNYFSKFSKTLIEPRFTFNQHFLNNFTFEVLGELKSQITSQIIDLQNDFLGIEKRRWTLANNNQEIIIENNRTIYPVPVIESNQLSTGIRYNKNKFLVSVEAYIKKVDGITTRSQGFQNQYQFISAIGNYQIKGIDFLINKQYNNSSIWLSYSYSKNEYLLKI